MTSFAMRDGTGLRVLSGRQEGFARSPPCPTERSNRFGALVAANRLVAVAAIINELLQQLRNPVSAGFFNVGVVVPMPYLRMRRASRRHASARAVS